MTVERRVLEWAISRSGARRGNLERRFPALPKWLEGSELPTLKQVERLARATHTPFGYLFLSEPPTIQIPAPYFRTSASARSDPSADLIETIFSMQRRQSWMREFLEETGAEPLPFVSSVAITTPAAIVAQKMRDSLGLEPEWAAGQDTWTDALRVLAKAMDASRILVVINGVVGNDTHRKLNPEEFRGFVLVDPYAPLVFVNGADARAAQMFTLAHELAHVLFGRSAVFDLTAMVPSEDEVELACNRAAAEFLVPENLLREHWSRDLDDAARRFKVSRLVILRRLLDVGLISQDEYFRRYHEHMRSDARRRQVAKGGNFYALQRQRIGETFGTAVARAVREGKLPYGEAYRLTGLRGRAFEAFARSLDEG